MNSYETGMKALSIADVFAAPRMTRSTFETTLTLEPTSQSYNTHRSGWWAAHQPEASLPTDIDRREAGATGAAVTESESDSDRVRTLAPAAEQMAGGSMEVRVYRDSYATPWGFRIDGGADLGRPISVKRVRTLMYPIGTSPSPRDRSPLPLAHRSLETPILHVLVVHF